MSLDAGLPATGEWECMECGYIEAGIDAQRPPKCPDCGAPRQALEFFPFWDDDDQNASYARTHHAFLDDLDLDAVGDEDEDLRDP